VRIGNGRYETESQIAGAAISNIDNAVLTLSWDGYLSAWSATDGKKLEHLTAEKLSDRLLRGSGDGAVLLTAGTNENADIWRQRRPVGWRGLLSLPVFWLTIVLGIAFLLSFVLDRRR
jgi:hypothetical protein